MLKKDGNELFKIANKYSIRHHNADQYQELCDDCRLLEKGREERKEITCILCKEKLEIGDKFCKKYFRDLEEFEDLKELKEYIRITVKEQGRLTR